MYYLVTKFIIYFNAKLFRQFVEAWKANTAKYFVLMIHCIMDIMDIHDIIWTYSHLSSFRCFQTIWVSDNSVQSYIWPSAVPEARAQYKRNPLRLYFKNLLSSTKCWNERVVDFVVGAPWILKLWKNWWLVVWLIGGF